MEGEQLEMASQLTDLSTLQIIQYPHSTLQRPSKSIKRVDENLHAIVRRMFDLMYEADGLGLAANQVNLPLRLFIVNLQAVTNEDKEVVLINPVISRPKGHEEGSEGCLSFPDLYAKVNRAKQIHIQAYTLDGDEINQDVDGFFARVIQHETDHLDGIVFPDRMTPVARQEIEVDLEEFELEFRNALKCGVPLDHQRLEAELVQCEARYC